MKHPVSIEGSHLETRRWLILIVFCMFTFTNATGFVTYSPILDISESYYNASESSILWMANIWYVAYVVLSIPALFLFKWRLDVCLNIGTALNALGGWIRYAAGSNYTISLIGSLTISIA